MSRIAAILLAAGRGTRFGGDKLAVDLAGRPLVAHAAETVGLLPLARRFAVVATGDAPPGFEAVRNPAGGQGRSLALGIGAAREADADAALVVLADMPLISGRHHRCLLDRYRGPDTLVASRSGGTRLPPALIGRDWFARLEALTGDRGARHWLVQAACVDGDPDELMDVDTPADLDRAQRWLDRPAPRHGPG